MGAQTDLVAALLGSASGLEIFEELRFVWEYLAAAALLLATQASARSRGLYRGAIVLVAFSLLSLGYFPYKDALTALNAPRLLFACWYLGISFAMTFSLLWVFDVSMPDLLWTSATAYVTQHIVYVLVHEALALWLLPTLPSHFPAYVLLSVGCCAVIYGAIYRLLAKPLRLGAGRLLSDTPHGTLSQTVVLAMLFSSTFGFQHLFQMSESRATAVWMDLLVCGMLLGIQYTSYLAIIAGREAQLTESMLTDASTHWELSQALLSRLGSFMHDVWHIVLGVKVAKVPGLEGYLDRVERQLGDYRSMFFSNNDVLNSALAAARLLCESREIPMTVSVGKLRSGSMPAADLYALLDGLTRLAIEQALQMDDASRRAVDLELSERAGMLLASCSVTCLKGAKAWDDELGIRRLTLLAEKSGGTVQAFSEADVATLRAVIPLARERA
ncbi:hypothetical protein [Paratractidigestivibacter faecalis]|uniref:GGDEF domain-containing protein n=1 Tax=Paratractidigestivibacter faecalis TaxID=2292441 RepID=A0ABV1IH60_9ACTN